MWCACCVRCAQRSLLGMLHALGLLSCGLACLRSCATTKLVALTCTPDLHPPPITTPPAVENDDRPGSYSLQDLLFLHNLIGVPLVFDFHHHKASRWALMALSAAFVGLRDARLERCWACYPFVCNLGSLWCRHDCEQPSATLPAACSPASCRLACLHFHHSFPSTHPVVQFCTGGLSEREAFEAAIRTWPQGVRPVCHWSESQASGREGRGSGTCCPWMCCA